MGEAVSDEEVDRGPDRREVVVGLSVGQLERVDQVQGRAEIRVVRVVGDGGGGVHVGCVTTIQDLTGYVQPDIVCNCSST